MEFQGIYLSYIWTVIYTTKALSMQRNYLQKQQNCWKPSCYAGEDFQMPLLNLDHDFWRRSFEKTKQQKVKIRKCGAIVAKVCGKEVAGFFWDRLLREIPNVNKNHRRPCTRRTLCCIKYREDKYQKNKIINLLGILDPFIALISMQCISTQQKGYLSFVLLHFFPFLSMWWEDLSAKVKIMNAKKLEVKIAQSQA